MIERLFKFGEILLPKNVDVHNWAVVACDEHTSNPAYWNNLENELVDPTSLKIIFPECYLSDDKSDRIENILTKQNEYLGAGIFETLNGIVPVKRVTACGTSGGGLCAS